MKKLTTVSAEDLELPENPEARKAKIREWFPVEIKHPGCAGEGIAFYYRNLPIRGRQFDNMSAMRPDGSRPVRMYPRVRCGSCGEEVVAEELWWRGKTW